MIAKAPTTVVSSSPVDFLAIGHVCRDLTPEGWVIGGAAAYTAAIAQTLGCRTAIVTSGAPHDEWAGGLDGILIHRVDAPAMCPPYGRARRWFSWGR
jgi:hypothetical protein